jgi:hypothetical protein
MKNKFELKANEVIEIFEEKFKHRSLMPWQKKIDQMCGHIAFENGYRPFILMIQNMTVSCYTEKKTQDHMALLSDAIFFDNERVYFLYLLLLEMVDLFEEIRITFSVIHDREAYRAARKQDYFYRCIDLIKLNDLNPNQKIEELDRYGDQIGIKQLLHLHKNTKSAVSVLTGIEKNKSFGINTSTVDVRLDIETIQSGQVKRIPCPICQSYNNYLQKNGEKPISFTKTLNKTNKNTLFLSKNKIIFNCDHEKTPKYKEIPIEIDLEEYKKEIKKRGLNKIDFMIYNYPYFFERFMQGIEIEW